MAAEVERAVRELLEFLVEELDLDA